MGYQSDEKKRQICGSIIVLGVEVLRASNEIGVHCSIKRDITNIRLVKE